MMEFEGEFTVDGTPEDLWKYFTDPDILEDAVPGCDSMTLKSPSQINTTIAVGVGSVKPSFDVEGVVTAAERPERLEIQGSGEASRNSFEVSAWEEFEDNGDGTTTVTWRAEAEVSGIIASMGERALGSVADNLVNDFFETIEDHVNAGTPAESRIAGASEEELIEAGYEPGEEGVPEPEPAGGVAENIVGTAMDVTQGLSGDEETDVGSAGYLGAGVVLGVAVSAIWRRIRGSGRSQPTEKEREAADRRQPVGGSERSWLTLLLALGLGAAAALAWNQSQSDTAETSIQDRPVEEPAEETEAAESVHENSDDAGSAKADDQQVADPGSDDPLDRLESR